VPSELATIPVTELARGAWDEEKVSIIKKSVASELTDPEFQVFLETAARYGLDPLRQEIWPMKMGGKFVPLVGRDGLLSIAQRHPDFAGWEGDVVREFDTFRKTSDPDRPIVYRNGRRPTYFFAPWAEYNRGQQAWRTHPSAMILKAALATALRLAFNLSGLYAAAEFGLEDAPGGRVDLTAPPAEPDYGEGPDGEWLRALVAEANRVQPGSYRPAKLAALMGASDFEREALAASLVEFIVERGGQVPGRPDPDVIDAEAVEA
jgi:phage recombination protein Bet